MKFGCARVSTSDQGGCSVLRAVHRSKPTFGVIAASADFVRTSPVRAALSVDALIAEGHSHDALAVADVLIERNPMFAYIMVKKAPAAYHLLRTEFHEKSPTAQDVPQEQRTYLAYLQRVNQSMFYRAEPLGWRPVGR